MLIEPLPLPVAQPAMAASVGRCLLVVDSNGRCWVDGRLQLPLDRALGAVALSPAGIHAAALLPAQACITVWRIDGPVTARIDVHQLRVTGLAFLRRAGDEVLAVVSTHRLTLYGVDGLALRSQSFGGLAVGSIHSLAGGRGMAVLGREFAESRDTLAVFGADELPVPVKTMEFRFRFREGLVDSATALAVGPAGPDHVLVFRAPDGEEPLGPEDGQAIVPREWGYRGWYVSTFSGRTVARIPAELTLASGAPICASASYIAAAAADRIFLVQRDGHGTQTLDLRWLAASPTGDHVVAAAPDGALQRIHLGRPVGP